MAIVGSLQSGLTGDNTTIYLKSALDFTAAIIFASQLGIGVIFSSAFVLVYQGAIVLLAQWVAPVLNDAVIAEMTLRRFCTDNRAGAEIARITN